MQWLSKTGLGKSEVETRYLTSFEKDFNKHKSKIICYGDSKLMQKVPFTFLLRFCATTF